MGMYRNYYICWACTHGWNAMYEGRPEDECPECGSRGCSPHTSVLVEDFDGDEEEGDDDTRGYYDGSDTSAGAPD